jgi:hypothetical protein
VNQFAGDFRGCGRLNSAHIRSQPCASDSMNERALVRNECMCDEGDGVKSEEHVFGGQKMKLSRDGRVGRVYCRCWITFLEMQRAWREV